MSNEKIAHDIINELDSLKHYGVLGMKWGKQNGSRHTNNKRKSGNQKSIKKKKGPAIKSISDADLRKKLNRIQMEKQYQQLTKREKTSGEKLVNEIMVGAVKTTATAYVLKYLSKGVEEAIKKTVK